MTRSLNKVIIIGNLGSDPEMRYTANGKPITTFSVATSRTWVTSNGDRREATEWFSVVAWNKLAEICNQLLRKGSRVYVEGHLQTRQWVDNNGCQHYRTELVANEMLSLDNHSRNENAHFDDDDEEPELPF